MRCEESSRPGPLDRGQHPPPNRLARGGSGVRCGRGCRGCRRAGYRAGVGCRREGSVTRRREDSALSGFVRGCHGAIVGPTAARGMLPRG